MPNIDIAISIGFIYIPLRKNIIAPPEGYTVYVLRIQYKMVGYHQCFCKVPASYPAKLISYTWSKIDVLHTPFFYWANGYYVPFQVFGVNRPSEITIPPSILPLKVPLVASTCPRTVTLLNTAPPFLFIAHPVLAFQS